MLTVDEVRKHVLEAVDVLEPVDTPVPLALGMVAADDLVAPHPLPRFNNSAMDGYAVRGSDAAQASEEAPVVLDVLGEVRAGEPGDIEVLPGTAARIMTGAPVPKGADAVVQVEETSEHEGRVTVMGGTRSGRNVRPAGEDVGAGDVVVPAGLELTPGELALLAALGLSPVRVISRPRVAILVTGDELVESDADPGRGQIRDSNSVALRALVQDAGGEVVSARVVPDDRTETVRIFRSASEDADLLVSSGGVSVGRYDYVRDVVEELGQIDLWRVAMQPGKPVVLGEAAGTPFLGLPGNPVSVHVCFEQFVRPALRKMRGCRLLLPPLVKATLTEGLSKRPGRLHFVRVRLAFDDKSATWMATPTGLQGSHIQSSLVDCNGVARFEREETQLKAGDSVSVELWSLPHSEQ